MKVAKILNSTPVSQNAKKVIKQSKQGQQLRKGGKNKLTSEMEFSSISNIAGIAIASTKKKLSGIKTQVDEFPNIVKGARKLAKNQNLQNVNKRIKQYKKILKKPNISENTKNQVQHRIDELGRRKDDIVEGFFYSFYPNKLKEEKISGLSNAISSCVSSVKRTKIHKNSHTRVFNARQNNSLDVPKKQSFIREIERHTGRKYTSDEFDNIVSIFKLQDDFRCNKKGSPENIFSRATLKNLKGLPDIKNELEALTGKSFKNYSEVEQYFETFAKTLQL